MAGQLIIKDLEFQGHIGVTVQERRATQPIGIDLKLDYPMHMFHMAAESDDITKAVDYADVVQRVVQIGTKEEFNLLEALADRLTRMLFQEFAVSGVSLWVRKLASPIQGVRGSVGIRLKQTRDSYITDPKPADFLKDVIYLLPKGQVLDVAAGRGRNALYLAEQGFSVEAIDRDEQALNELTVIAQQRSLTNLTTRIMDLETGSGGQPDLPKEQYDLVLVFFYLYRPLFPALLQALRPGGILLYETFLIDNHLHYQHPRRREFCLAHNELLRLSEGLRVLYYKEGVHENGHGLKPAFTARLLAQREK
ncbi:MAG: dihydroneopterin aldolase [Nitrospiraceae bacterium]